jgi:hypothetical protein
MRLRLRLKVQLRLRPATAYTDPRMRVFIIIIYTITVIISTPGTPSSLSTTFVHQGHGLPGDPSTNEHLGGGKDSRFGGDPRFEDVAWTLVMLSCRVAFIATSSILPALDGYRRLVYEPENILPQSRGKEVQKGRMRGGKEKAGGREEG